MVGDWVRLRYKHWVTNEEVVKDFKVSQIRKAWDGNELDAWCSESGNMGKVSLLEPIPLTLEILEKNGFGEYEYNEVYGDEIEVEVNLNEWPIDEGSCPGFSSRIQYVHELQHVLRLCGIEKEIIL